MAASGHYGASRVQRELAARVCGGSVSLNCGIYLLAARGERFYCSARDGTDPIWLAVSMTKSAINCCDKLVDVCGDDCNLLGRSVAQLGAQDPMYRHSQIRTLPLSNGKCQRAVLCCLCAHQQFYLQSLLPHYMRHRRHSRRRQRAEFLKKAFLFVSSAGGD